MRRTRHRTQPADGFTLIELLVVMIIIAILAAIAIPALLGEQRKAREAAAKSDVETIAREVVSFYVDGLGPLAVRAGSDPLDWQLVSGGTRVVASGRLSAGNSIGSTTAITSDSAYCVSVVPTAAGTRPWKATQAGLDVGPC